MWKNTTTNRILFSLTIFFLLFSGSTFAADCEGREKEMLELTYMSKVELAREYCSISWLADRKFDSSSDFTKLEAFDLAKQSRDEGFACMDYKSKVLRVAKKDFQVESFECEEDSPNVKTP